MTSREQQPQRRRTPIQPVQIRGWQNGWLPDFQKTGIPIDSVYDLLNVVWNEDFSLSKRHGYTLISNAVTGLDAPDHVLAPRVFTQTGGVYPNYTQQVLHFNKNDGEMWKQSLGNLWAEHEDTGEGANFHWSNHSVGIGSDTAINRFRVWPITAVTYGDDIYVSTLRYGGYDSNTTTADAESGDWQTQNGDQESPTRPIIYDVLNNSISRPQLHDLDGDTTGFPSCRTMITKYARIFAANLFKEGVYRYPSRIYWCGDDALESGVNTQLWEADNYIEVGADDGQEVVRLQSFGDQIVVFKNQSIWSLVGTDDTTFALYQVDDKLGTEGTYASTSTAGALYFFDERTGVWTYDGADFQNISLPIKEKLLDELNREAAYKVVVEIVGDLLYVSIPVGTGSSVENTVTYVYDVNLQHWTRWDYGICPTPFPMYTDMNVVSNEVAHVRNPFAGRGTTGGLFMLNDALNDNGSAISSYVTLPWFNPESFADRHRLRRLEILGDETDGEVTVAVFSDLEFDTAKATITYDLATGTENALTEDQTLDDFLWSWLCLRFTQNGDDEDMNLYAIGMSISDRPSPRGIFARTGYSN